MKLIRDLLKTLPEGQVRHVNIGLHWTAVVVQVGAEQRCGLASTLHNDHSHGVPDVPQAGGLEDLPALELASCILERQPTLSSVAMATINAMLPRQPGSWVDLNAEEVIAERGDGKSVVLVGHFPFTPRLRDRVGQLTVLELDPQPGDRPVTAAQDVIPTANVIAITSMTLLNHTLNPLMALISPESTTIMLGPTTPLSPVLFDHGVDLLCGAVVVDIEPVLAAVRQGANFRQVHRAGVRLVSINHPRKG